MGGTILTVESTKTSGKGNLILTGSLGNFIKESACTAYSLVKSLANKYEIDEGKFNNEDIHIHIPQLHNGVNGPSAGCAIATSILSTLTNKKIDNNLAMTGEISLKGKVLPIGGVKEKVYAAKLAGITNILLPKQNEKDYKELSESIKEGLNITFVNTIEEVLNIAIKG